MEELLIKLEACQDGIDWAGDKTWEEVYRTCERGDWLLWLYAKTTDLTIESNLRLLTLAKGKCANTVRHLMKDERSIDAVDTAIAYGEGKATRDELDKSASYASYAAAWEADAASYASYAAAFAAAFAASYAAAWEADAPPDAASYASYAASYAADADKRTNQLETANIVRNIISIEKFNIK